MRRVVIVGFDEVQILDVAGPTQVFAAASQETRRTAYEIVFASSDGGAIRTSSGLVLHSVPLAGIDPRTIEILLVAGGEKQALRGAIADRALMDWLEPATRKAKRVCSVCTGAFVLAATGVLDRRRVATHWQACRALARLHPAISVDDDALYVKDGRIWTSAGVTAGIDMSLALVERDLGKAVAMRIAKRLVLYARRPGTQAQFSALLEAQSKVQGPLAEITDWMAQHFAHPQTVEALAERAAMSPRSFHRKFVAATSETPAKFLEKLRLDAACQLLSEPRATLKVVAARSGFGTAARLAQVFERRFGLTPGAYRRLHASGS